VFWNGKRIVHPPQRGGFLPIVLEMWRQNVYRIGEFYVPKPGDVVLDVGAHVGLFTIRILTAEPQCRVIAIEPSPENFACLQKNIATLDSRANARVCQLGVGGSYGKIKMMDIPTNRSFDARTAPADERDATAVDLVPLEHVFELAGTDQISLLKMDIEGGENEAFTTADPALFSRIERLAMEYHDNYVYGTLALLKQKLAPTHELTVLPDAGQLHGRLFAVRKDLVFRKAKTDGSMAFAELQEAQR
jgi:FkbM family methyltransferase